MNPKVRAIQNKSVIIQKLKEAGQSEAIELIEAQERSIESWQEVLAVARKKIVYLDGQNRELLEALKLTLDKLIWASGAFDTDAKSESWAKVGRPAVEAAFKTLNHHKKEIGESKRDGVSLIAEERKRQVEVRGWTDEHDAQWKSGELALAAACYAIENNKTAEVIDKINSDSGFTVNAWPWDGWWKPSDSPIRNLQKAGALIAAEIDRLLKTVEISKDGDQFCATYKDFDCLQTSPAGFGNTPEEAILELIKAGKK